MKVVSEAPVQDQVLTIELDDNDGRKIFSNWDSWSGETQFRRLSLLADIFSVHYLSRRNAISSSFASKRIKELTREMSK